VIIIAFGIYKQAIVSLLFVDQVIRCQYFALVSVKIFRKKD